MFVREDFRRDGLAANFLVDEELIYLVSKIIIGSKINIGYPAICEKEYEMCSRILRKASNNSTELCVVGHAREDHLNKMSKIIENIDGVSANAWMPISNYFLNQTVKISSKKAFNGLKSIIKKWKKKSNKPFDMAFADCTARETELPQRIFNWADYCLNLGVRNIIICDTRGIGNKNCIESIFDKLSIFGNRIEFHPHNDNNNALENIEVVLKKGVEIIGTSFFKSGERKSMIDPRELIDYGLYFNSQIFDKFQKKYYQKIGNPNEILKNVYGDNIIVTGSQFRLRGRNKNLEMRFGVTSDIYIYITSKILGRQITKEELADLKNKLLYFDKNIFLKPKELCEYYPEVKEKCPI